jgi:hypothetical protein
MTCCRIKTQHELTEENEYENILKELETRTVHSHIIKASSLIEKVLAFLFGIYPCSILTYSNQRKIIYYDGNTDSYHINKKMLRKNLGNVNSGSYIKFCTFDRTLTKFSGHSMLTKKNGNNDFTFFATNNGIRFNLITPILG